MDEAVRGEGCRAVLRLGTGLEGPPPGGLEVESRGRTPAVGGKSTAAYSGTPTFRRGFRAHRDGPPNREIQIMKHPVGLAPPAGGGGPTFSSFPWNCQPETFASRSPPVSSIDSTPPSPPPACRVESIRTRTDPPVSGAAISTVAPGRLVRRFVVSPGAGAGSGR